MSTISTKQEKRSALVDPIYVLAALALILTLLLAWSLSGNAEDAINDAIATLSGGSARVSSAAEVSFAADQGYWAANCTSGWSSDSTCDAIVQRVQSCSISTTSAYCSEYDRYLQPFRNQ